MGTKGSFVIAQLTNLIFLRFIYSEEYPDLKDPFFLEVGDDMIVEGDMETFSKRFNDIGVPININKTKVSTECGNFLEFVSRNA